ncbi:MULTISPECIES: hypothetical protein [Cyanophyceae]|jgi:hypothetical protein|uniref:Uncharacterized protein n=2 Tax=Cyanophyceae TaxID=3028117 RepID=A0ABU5TFD2_9CYAN|nr:MULTISPECIES: hypothetical protein [Cyanophyceae]MBD2316840.1 hypothetical protein [Phormidium tenue FACHB-1050]MEA5476972.1 hypothetical protein [Pseudanabaena galeata UHCC 0370]OYQ64709.1 hypothetical protein B9G53_10345 [Pseudanabaena sp. SR411]
MRLIFTSRFNRFQTINATQAWSLFLTGCKKDDSLGKNPMIGKYVTVAILGAIIAQILEAILLAS